MGTEVTTSQDITFRLANRTDQTAVVRIMNEAIEDEKNAYTEVLTERVDSLWFRSLYDKSLALMVLEVNGEVIGWGSLTPYRSGRHALRHVAEISFYVTTSMHRKGFGARLIDELESYSAEIGLTHLLAILLADNKGSRILLEKKNYEQWALLPDIVSHVDGRKSHLYMGKSLMK